MLGEKTLAPDTPNIPLTEFDCVMTDTDPSPHGVIHKSSTIPHITPYRITTGYAMT